MQSLPAISGRGGRQKPCAAGWKGLWGPGLSCWVHMAPVLGDQHLSLNGKRVVPRLAPWALCTYPQRGLGECARRELGTASSVAAFAHLSLPATLSRTRKKASPVFPRGSPEPPRLEEERELRMGLRRTSVQRSEHLHVQAAALPCPLTVFKSRVV